MLFIHHLDILLFPLFALYPIPYNHIKLLKQAPNVYIKNLILHIH
ncbi:hypothetical protein M23134_04538 [Microscilla marina ATCC 23134]|uniref:Uncharacterized protein n=1 Tax=Microscilla marina ATCC 23134 TaxID=313606 RepID=A1ZWB9_MICM2|nr:hypothetical protein M23134_04538 [Microscilla marina ATCC 23134]